MAIDNQFAIITNDLLYKADMFMNKSIPYNE